MSNKKQVFTCLLLHLPHAVHQWLDEILEHCPGVKVRMEWPPLRQFIDSCIVPAGPSWLAITYLKSTFSRSNRASNLALKCDLRDDRAVKERLDRYREHTVQYEEGLAVARRIRASRYLGTVQTSSPVSHQFLILVSRMQLNAQQGCSRGLLWSCTGVPEYPTKGTRERGMHNNVMTILCMLI
jgi:hypothetical protein